VKSKSKIGSSDGIKRSDSLRQERSNTDLLLDEIRRFYTETNLTDHPGRALLSISDGLLSWVFSLLREEQPIVPQAKVDDWSELLTQLQYHGIIPLLYLKIRHLTQMLRPPEVVITRMRETFLLSQARYLRMERQLAEILRALKSKGICPLIIKGPALAWSVYPDPATRPSVDIDLLVKAEQYLTTRKVLNRLKYQCPYERFEVFQHLFNSESFVCQNKTIRRVMVDLHWSVFQYHGIERNDGLGEFFHRAKIVETPTLNFKTLSSVDALIQAAFHLILHHPNSMRLLWISDIALLAQQLNVPKDWEVLQERTSQFRASLAMEKALKLAQLWYGLRVPEGYDDFTNSPSVEENEKAELAYVTNKHTTDIRLGGYLANFRKSPNKIQYLMKFLFPRPHYIRATYPPSRNWLLPLSYVRRWGHWLAKLVQYGLHLSLKATGAGGRGQRAESEGGRLQDARFKMQGEESSKRLMHRAESEGQRE